MKIVNLIDSDKLTDHEVIAYSGLEGELVVAVQRKGVLVLRVIVTPQRPPQIMVVDPLAR